MRVQYALFLVLAALTLALAGKLDARKSSFRMMSEISPLQTEDRFLQSVVNYSNPYDNFKPTKSMDIALKFSGVHELPNSSGSYLTIFLVTPIILFALGILALVVMCCGIFSRNCFACCSCLPKSIDDEENKAETAKKLKSRRLTLYVVFYLFGLFALVANLCTFIGNAEITSGKSVVLYMIWLRTRFNDLIISKTSPLQWTVLCCTELYCTVLLFSGAHPWLLYSTAQHYLYICPAVYHPTCSSACLPVYLPTCLSVCLSLAWVDGNVSYHPPEQVLHESNNTSVLCVRLWCRMVMKYGQANFLNVTHLMISVTAARKLNK